MAVHTTQHLHFTSEIKVTHICEHRSFFVLVIYCCFPSVSSWHWLKNTEWDMWGVVMLPKKKKKFEKLIMECISEWFFHSFQISCTINIFPVATIEILLPPHIMNLFLYLWIMQNFIWKYKGLIENGFKLENLPRLLPFQATSHYLQTATCFKLPMYLFLVTPIPFPPPSPPQWHRELGVKLSFSF